MESHITTCPQAHLLAFTQPNLRMRKFVCFPFLYSAHCDTGDTYRSRGALSIETSTNMLTLSCGWTVLLLATFILFRLIYTFPGPGSVLYSTAGTQRSWVGIPLGA